MSKAEFKKFFQTV